MKKIPGLLFTLLISSTLLLGSWTDAEARRFGGARSFGGKSTFSSPYRRSVSPKRSASQQKVYKQNQAARQGMSRRGGLMGMLGGLALGGLLGAMFFGGAFEGFNFMDLLVFGGIAYLLYKMFAVKAGKSSRSSYNDSNSYSEHFHDNDASKPSYDDQNYSRQNAAGFDTDGLFKNDRKNDNAPQQDFSQDADFEDRVIPEGFDETDFLAGAKAAYMALQKAWDNGDLAEIRGLTTEKVFAEIQQQLQTSDIDNQTDILKLNANLLDLRDTGSELEAVVLFDSIMREDVHTQAEQVREVWHFIKPKSSNQPKWYLDGIQQLEN